jgi:hypothetical protein
MRASSAVTGGRLIASHYLALDPRLGIVTIAVDAATECLGTGMSDATKIA